MGTPVGNKTSAASNGSIQTGMEVPMNYTDWLWTLGIVTALLVAFYMTMWMKARRHNNSRLQGMLKNALANVAVAALFCALLVAVLGLDAGTVYDAFVCTFFVFAVLTGVLILPLRLVTRKDQKTSSV